MLHFTIKIFKRGGMHVGSATNPVSQQLTLALYQESDRDVELLDLQHRNLTNEVAFPSVKVFVLSLNKKGKWSNFFSPT